jgi:large subunit ribosomal protein L19
MSQLIHNVERRQLRRLPKFRAGDRVRVHFQVIEGSRKRTQVFEGVVLKLQGSGARRTFTVRKLSFGVGVERTFPLHSPKIERVEVVARGEVRRAKLYYLRDRIGRRARVRERRDLSPQELAEMAAMEEAQKEVEAQAGAESETEEEAVAGPSEAQASDVGAGEEGEAHSEPEVEETGAADDQSGDHVAQTDSGDSEQPEEPQEKAAATAKEDA